MDQFYFRVPLYTEDGEELYTLYMSTGNGVKHHSTTVEKEQIRTKGRLQIRLSLEKEQSGFSNRESSVQSFSPSIFIPSNPELR